MVLKASVAVDHVRVFVLLVVGTQRGGAEGFGFLSVGRPSSRGPASHVVWDEFVLTLLLLGLLSVLQCDIRESWQKEKAGDARGQDPSHNNAQ